MTIRTRLLAAGGEGELDGDLILAREICIGDFCIRDLERGAILDVEGEFRFAEITLAPVPPTESVFLLLERDPVEKFEGFGSAVEVLLTLLNQRFAPLLPATLSNPKLTLKIRSFGLTS